MGHILRQSILLLLVGVGAGLLVAVGLTVLPGPVARAAVGNITTVAGGGVGDGGPATSAHLGGLDGVAVDAAGNLFIADRNHSRIRKVAATTGVITTVAGTGAYGGFSGDGGPATSANLLDPQGVAVDTKGNLFIADMFNDRIRRVDATTGVITTVAGTGTAGFSGDGGPATSADLRRPIRVAVDGAGNLFIVDWGNHRIRKVSAATGVITTLAGTDAQGFSGDGGPASSANLRWPSSVAVDAGGNLFIADTVNHRIRRVDAATGVITTVAGSGPTGFETGSFAGDRGPATSASLSRPSSVAVDAGGNLFIADAGNNRIRRVDAATGVITTVAGTGTFPFSGDGGPATSASLAGPEGVAVDAAGNLFIADRNSHRVRKVTAATGVITTVAGTGTFAFSGDGGPATSASLRHPLGVAVDAAGNLFIADERNHRIRRVDAATGVITTVAGSGPTGYDAGSFAGDGGPATSANLRVPQGVAVDAKGNLFIADAGNSRIRRVDAATGVITTVAGSGADSGFSGDGGPATSARLPGPQGVAVDAAGNLFIADIFNYRIRIVSAATGVITTVAGTGTFAFSGDGGPATSASLRHPRGVAVDAAGNLFIADRSNDRIRKVVGVAAAAPGPGRTTISGTVTLQGRTVTFPAGTGHGIVTVTLNPGGVTGAVNADGTFQIPNVLPGTFTLTASAPGYVSRQRANVAVTGSPVTAPQVQLRCGLVNNDNFVNINDITATVASFGTSPAARVDAQGRFVDQNGDGFVNINDITCVVSGFGTTSPQAWE